MLDIQKVSERIVDQLATVILGKRSVLQTAVISFLCNGHLLIEDIPGVGKTVLARSLAILSGCSFKRIQFTPDLLPSDVVGASIFNQETNKFEIKRGPIFGQIILADEINRATPKTQSALLEAMDERKVTIDGTSYVLPSPFIVIATQNPIEYEGTFPLPEAQLDRFFMKITLGYPGKNDEVNILSSQEIEHPINKLSAIMGEADFLEISEELRKVFVSEKIKQYIVELVQKTRKHEDVFVGASPRGSLALMKAVQAKAAMEGRKYALPDDVKDLLIPVLSHRIILNVSARMNEVSIGNLLNEILTSCPAPGGNFSD
jgi:MoxR-like ATPase